jgi:hypothetical protein
VTRLLALGRQVHLYGLLRRFRGRPGPTVDRPASGVRPPAVPVTDHPAGQEPVPVAAASVTEPFDRLAGPVDPTPREHGPDVTGRVVQVDGDTPGALDTPTPPGGVLRVIVHPHHEDT